MKTVDYQENLVGYCEHVTELIESFYPVKEVLKDMNLTNEEGTRNYLRTEPADNGVFYVYWCNNCKKEENEYIEAESDYLYIGECPVDENPFPEYTSYQTCIAFLLQLTNTWVIPKGGRLAIKTELGGGGYHMIVAHYQTMYPESLAWAMFLEGNTPEKWSPAAYKLLKGIN